MNKEINTSIIIPSFMRPHLLRWGLESLSRQECSYSFEVLVFNDGVEDGTRELCEQYKDKLNIRYFFTGERNSEELQWRCPGFVLNYAVKQAEGKNIIISTAEIYLIENNLLQQTIEAVNSLDKTLVIPYGKDCVYGKIEEKLKESGSITLSDYNSLRHSLATWLPFFMAMKKEDYIKIGGYDEDFIGFGYDDNNFIERLTVNDYKYHQILAHVIHLYHSRVPRERVGLKNRDEKLAYNKKIYEEKKKQGYKILEQKDINSVENIWYLEKIPKIAHFYWGEKTLPYLRYLTVASFIKYNPDWEIRFYTPAIPQSEHPWTSSEQSYKIAPKEDYYNQLKKLPITFIQIDFRLLNLDNKLAEVHKSDYLRLFLLSAVGGLWSDMDIIYFDSITNLTINKKENKKIDTVLCHNGFYFSIGFLMASVNNTIYEQLWKAALKESEVTGYQTIGCILMEKLLVNFNTVTRMFYANNIANLSMASVYNYNSHMINTIYNKIDTEPIIEENIGLHWYGGHVLAEEYVNNLTDKNYKNYKNTLAKAVDISINNLKRATIAENRAIPDVYININNEKTSGLTIHTICRDEPFIYYAVKSVYNHADKVLLYDTGTTNKLALEGIAQLLDEDKEHKIIYKTFLIGDDEKNIIIGKPTTYKNKAFGVGKLRQLQINNTNTEFFLIVDGDEVHYEEGISKITNNIIPNLSKDKYEVGIPLLWFSSLDSVLHNNICPVTGRIMRTDKVCVINSYPNEAHAVKDTKEAFTLKHKNYLIYNDLKPFCHFHVLLKPEKRPELKTRKMMAYNQPLPEVMQENKYYIDKFLEKSNER